MESPRSTTWLTDALFPNEGARQPPASQRRSLSRRRPKLAKRLSLFGALYVLQGDTPIRARALHLREVHAQLLGLLTGATRRLRLLLLGCLLALTGLLSCLLRGVLHPLRLLGGFLSGRDGVLRRLADLVYRLARSVLQP